LGENLFKERKTIMIHADSGLEITTGRPASGHSSINRQHLQKGSKWVIWSFVILFIGYPTAVLDARRDSEKIKGETTLQPTQPGTGTTRAVPPIDAAAPDKTDTATFALG